jgi:hypothetical protein
VYVVVASCCCFLATPQIAIMLDTKGPEIRTAMLRNHTPIDLVAGQELTIKAVGAAYETFEGYKDAATGEPTLKNAVFLLVGRVCWGFTHSRSCGGWTDLPMLLCYPTGKA